MEGREAMEELGRSGHKQTETPAFCTQTEHTRQVPPVQVGVGVEGHIITCFSRGDWAT